MISTAINSKDTNLEGINTGTALTVALLINTHTPPPTRLESLSLRKIEKLVSPITTLSGIEELSHVSVTQLISELVVFKWQ